LVFWSYIIFASLTLSVSQNVDLLVDAVRKNDNIVKLSLKKTDLTSAGMMTLVEALSANTSITNVNISDNGSVSASEKLEKVRTASLTLVAFLLNAFM
jgi:hypothetical protein